MDSSPLVSGFTFIKNGLTLGYPIKESIESIEPLCDEIIINVGFDNEELKGDDGTYDYLRSHFPHKKFIFLKSFWDPNLQKQGLVLSQQTNIALEKCSGKFCQYIQGDEVIHENDLNSIHNSIIEMERNESIEGLVYNYIHFYGNVDVFKYTRSIYRREVRTIRNNIGLVSHLDAQGFRHKNGDKLKAIKIPATIYHYGWARKDKIMAQKIVEMDKLYHGDQGAGADPNYQYKKEWGLKKFTGTHPAIMSEWIKQHKNDIDVLSLDLEWKWKYLGLMFSDAWESLTGHRLGEYKSYKLID